MRTPLSRFILKIRHGCHKFSPRVSPVALTYGSGDEGDGFNFFPVVVDGQMPDARVHVLDKARVVGGDGYETPLHNHGPLQTMGVLGEESPPIQKFHKVKLQEQKVRRPDGWMDRRHAIRVTHET